jgi:RNase P subunit RPR2
MTREPTIWGMVELRDCETCRGCGSTDIRQESHIVYEDEGAVFFVFICNTCGDEMRWNN